MDYHIIQKKYRNHIGNKQVGGSGNIKKILYKLFDNRLLDIFIKTLGITTLNTTTLVPIALIMGNDEFSKFIKGYNKNKGLTNNKIPLLDHEILGNYLKLTGLGKLALSPNTLVPIGFIFSLLNFMGKNQSGGSKLPIGTNFPPSYVEVINNAFNVTGSDQGIWRSFPEINNNLQLNTNQTEPNNFTFNINGLSD